MFDFTPGPWKWSVEDSVYAYHKDLGKILVCDDLMIGDARLISCAPEMLEALIDIYNKQQDQSYSLSALNGTIRDSKKIIEKATGKTWEEIK